MEFNLHGKRINKKQAEKLEILFELFSKLHEIVDGEGYEKFLDDQGLTDNYDEIVNATDDLFISFGYAKKRLEEK